MVFVIGLIVASVIANLVERVLRFLRVDRALESVSPLADRMGLAMRPSRIIGRIVYWFLFVIFLIAASDALGLSTLSDFLRQIVLYIPNVVAAVAILFIAMAVANFIRDLIKSWMSSYGVAAEFVGTFAWWTFVVFGFLAALSQLHIAENIINILVSGFVAMLALAGGLSFGLGGREHASQFIGRLRERFQKHPPA